MRTVLVTGASSGIGRATAREFAAHGFRVFGTVRRPEDGDNLRGELDSSVRVLRCDVRDLESVERMVREVRAETDRLDVVVNNAGYGTWVALEDIRVEDFWAVFEVNVRGLVAVTKGVLPLLRRGSTIVNVSSLAGRIALPLLSAYNGSKFAVEGITDCLRMELAPLGIRVVAVQPGGVRDTRFSDHAYDASEPYWNRPSRYAPAYEALRRDRETGMPGSVPAAKVARVIRRAAEARRPRARYATQPGQAILVSVSKVLPRRLIDRAIARFTGFAVSGGKP